jgi:superfamily I DNA/RNA helicase
LVTFNRRAAGELRQRAEPVLAAVDLPPDAVRIRTFHALGREILLSANQPAGPVVDRRRILADLFPRLGPGERRRLDDAISRFKLHLGLEGHRAARRRDLGPVGRAFVAYEAALADLGGLDFDDLVARPLRLLRTNRRLCRHWQASAGELLVDEAQDVDRSQLDLALLLTAANGTIFLVGDDDQTIYGWRLADVRRILGLAAALPGIRRVHLVTNRRCPPAVVERAIRLVEHNRERFAKSVRPAPGARGRLILAPHGPDPLERVRRLLDSWPADGGSRAILARTNAELLPAAVVALERNLPFDMRVPWPELEDPRIDTVLARARALAAAQPELPLLPLLGRLRDPAVWVGEAEGAGAPTVGVGTGLAEARPGAGEARFGIANAVPGMGEAERWPSQVGRELGQVGQGLGQVGQALGQGRPPIAGPFAEASLHPRRSLTEPPPWADPPPVPHRDNEPDLEPASPDGEAGSLVDRLLAWAPPYPTLEAFAAAIADARARWARLRTPGATLTLSTIHATKGLEFDHVAVLGLDAGHFPNPHSLAEADSPERALEEERRLAYVAWTRARRSLTLVYDPDAPSPFLLEAFGSHELPLGPGALTPHLPDEAA